MWPIRLSCKNIICGLFDWAVKTSFEINGHGWFLSSCATVPLAPHRFVWSVSVLHEKNIFVACTHGWTNVIYVSVRIGPKGATPLLNWTATLGDLASVSLFRKRFHCCTAIHCWRGRRFRPVAPRMFCWSVLFGIATSGSAKVCNVAPVLFSGEVSIVVPQLLVGKGICIISVRFLCRHVVYLVSVE